MEPNSDVWVVLISTVGGIVVTYLTVKYKDRVVSKVKGEPRDRMETLFDGYESLIKQQQDDINRKSILIDHMERAMKKLSREIDELRSELQESRSSNQELQKQLQGLKAEYTK